MSNIGTSVLLVHLKRVKAFAQLVSKLAILTIMFHMRNTVAFIVIVGPKERNLAVL